MAQTALTLINPENKNITFKVFTFDDDSTFVRIQRIPCYTILLITEGAGKLETDFTSDAFQGNMMMCFTPYQPYSISSEGPIKGIALNFHSDFICVYKHHKEIACNGVLFDNLYQSPLLELTPNETMEFEKLASQMLSEMKSSEVAQYELLVSYLKIFLITATRIKISRQPEVEKVIKSSDEPFILQKLKDAIETHYRTKHSPSEYADLLSIAPKSLAKIIKQHFNKTLSAMISERIIIEAKRELYLTSKSVKEIAYELGFRDEFYFSRFFKTNADVSPQLYRNTVGFAKAEQDALSL